MKTRRLNNKDYVLCACRRRYVRLTPEEWVRQQFIEQLVTDYGYPLGLISVEKTLPTRGEQEVGCRRTDAVVYNPQMEPKMIIEFKRETIALTQTVFDQAAEYNARLHVPYLIICNGRTTIAAQITDGQCTFLQQIPEWKQLLN